MNQIPQWHPKLNVYRHENDGLLLLSELNSLLLREEQFPGMSLIDGQLTEEQISQKLATPYQGTLFFYQLSQLKKSGLIVEHDAQLPQYSNQSAPAATTLTHFGRQIIVSLSAAKPEFLAQWCSWLSEFSLMRNTIMFLLVDDMLDERIADIVTDAHNNRQYCCVLKVTGERLMIGPLTSKKRPLQWRQFQCQLRENQPLRMTAENLFPQQNNVLPFSLDQLPSEDNRLQLKQVLDKQFSAAKQQLALLTLNTNEVEFHDILDYEAEPVSFAEQADTPIDLRQCLSVFDHDGGSRSVRPELTLTRLSKLVSPITGIATHLEVLEGDEQDPINIYRTSFFKTPSKIQAQHIGNDSFVQVCLGKGVAHKQSQVSALCETIERYSAHFRGEEPSISAAPPQLEARYYDYQQLTPYSDEQYSRFADPQHPDSKIKQAAQKYDGSLIQWYPCWSLTRKDKVYVPLSTCFSNVPFEDEKFGRWHSNGCAAGNTLEEAILQALLELIERDAAAIWWYNQTPRPAFDMSRIPSDNLEKLSQSLERTHDFWILDITTDIAVPAMVAIGKAHADGGYIIGLGCHVVPEMAAQRALTELCQLIPIRNQNAAPFDFDAIVDGPYLHPCKKSTTVSIADKGHDIKQDILTVVHQLGMLGHETLVFNYSRSHLPIKTAKVFVPGLCHIWPQLDNQRLYQAPLRLGWLDEPKTEQTINPQALYI